MALADLSVKIGADTTGFNRGLKSVKTGLASLVKAGLGLAAAAGAAFGLKALENAFTGLQSSVMRTNDLFGDSAKYIKYFAENTGKAFGMAEANAYEYAAIYGNLFRSVTKDQAENSKVTIAMLKTSAVIASKTGRTMDDVMTRIRSGIMGNTEAIEDLGVYAHVGMLETTDAFKKIANGRSWQQLTFQEQQQIRILGILEQSHKQFGDEVQQGSAFSLSVLSGAFKDLLATMGRFVDAGLQPIIRGLTTLVQAATAGLKALAALFGLEVTVDTAKATDKAADAQAGLTDEIKGTNKALKQTTAGFDVFNDITKANTGVGDTGAGVGIDDSPFAGIEMPEFEETAIDMTWIDTLKSKFDSLQASAPFAAIADSIKSAWAQITPVASGISNTFSRIWADAQGKGQLFVSWFGGDFTANLQTRIQACGVVVSGLLDTFGTVFADIRDVVISPFLDTWATDWLPVLTQLDTQVVATFTHAFGEVKRVFDTVWAQGIKPALAELTKIWTDIMALIKSTWDAYGAPIFDAIRTAISKTADTLLNIWNTILKPVWDRIMETVDWLWTEHLKPLVDRILEFVATFIQAALDIYNQFILPLVDWFVTVFGPGISNAISFVVDVIGTIVAAVIDVVSGVIASLTGIIDFIAGVFTGDWARAWNGVKQIFKGVFDSLYAIVKTPLNLIIDAVNLLIRGLNRIRFDLPSWVPFVGGKSFGINISEIPKLASGAVVYAETPAIVGDNFNARQNPEVVAPLSSLKDMILEALMQKETVTGSSKEIHVTLTLENGETLVDLLIDPMNGVAKNLGYAPVFKPA